MLVSGQWFAEKCRWNFDVRYGVRIWSDPSEVTEGDRVFIRRNDIWKLLKMDLHPRVDLIVHNTDRRFHIHAYNEVKDRVRTVYAINATSPNVVKIPIGFRDDFLTPHTEILEIAKEQKNVNQRSILCLVNFMVANNPEYRGPILDHFRKQSFCTVQDYVSFHRGTSLNFRDPLTIKKGHEFYRTLCNTRFAICPFGTGLDTYRVYECILFGVIPIVQTSPLNTMYRRLPIWIVKDWSEVTEDSLLACKIQPNPNSVLQYKAPWE